MREKISVDVRNYSTMKVGGTARLFVECDTASDLLRALETYPDPFILGGGSNVVFPDGTFNPVVISTSGLAKPDPASVNGEGLARSAAGMCTDTFVDFCLARNAGGLESFAGLPGTIGGAVFMNARCYDLQMSDVLAEVDYWKDGTVGNTGVIAEDWGYKRSPFQPGGRLEGAVILGAAFALTRLSDAADAGDLRRAKALARAEELRTDRREKGHFRLPSCGSVFKNNRAFGMPTGKLIDELGLRGTRVGGAQVAPWHGNIIVNTGGASARDVKELVALVENRVYEERGWLLEREILLLNNDGRVA